MTNKSFRWRANSSITVGAMALAAVAGGLSLGGCPQTSPAFVELGGNVVGLLLVENIPNPSSIVASDDGRVFYCEKDTGRVRVLIGETLQTTAVLDLPVNSAGDRGLLGLALHPDFATNNRLYLFYSRSDTGADSDDPRAILDHRVVYFEIGDGNVATGGEIFVASLPADLTTNNIGGPLLFDRQARLLVAFGAAGNEAAVQDLSQLNGKLLRYNDDGSIAAENPDPNSPVLARGFRDPSGLSLDVRSEEVFLLDRLDDDNTEINRIVSGGNYGFPDATGITADESDRDPILLTTGGRTFSGAAFDTAGQYGQGTFGLLVVGDSAGFILAGVTLSNSRTSAQSEGVAVPRGLAEDRLAQIEVIDDPARRGQREVLAHSSR
jgi:glucose/arabinose dehydrogenase